MNTESAFSFARNGGDVKRFYESDPNTPRAYKARLQYGIEASRIRLLIAFLLLAAVIACPGFAQQQNQLDANPALFTVMAAINAAGFDADINSPSNHPLRAQVRAALAGKQFESLDEMKKFYAAHRQRDGIAELTQYISFGLSIDGPPDFKFRVPPNELPPDVFRMQGLERILPQFYKEANIEQLWQRAQPDYDQAIRAYHGPVSRSLLQTNAYLRNPTSGYLGRRFQIYIDLLAPPHQVQSRNYKDDYFVVVTPTPDLPIQQIQYAYLHYLLDPLSLKYSEQLLKLKSLTDYAQGAPALDDVYKSDFLLLATGSLIKAVESRLARGEQTRTAMVDEATREGFILTPAFAEGLTAYEKQPEAMRLYYPDLVNGVDLRHEVQRLDKVKFATERAGHKIASAPVQAPPELTGAAKTLAEADELYRGRDLEKAKQAFLRVLEQTSDKPAHAEAYYGLARVAALQKDPELAQKLFQKSLELGPDPQIKSWVYVYLGRLAAAAGEGDEAVRNYRAALAIDGASQRAKTEAGKELEKSANHNK